MKLMAVIAVLLIHAVFIHGQQQPPTKVKDYFLLLPERFFYIESCDRKSDVGCRRAKLDFLKQFLAVEDNTNAYLEANGDGSQESIKMTLFSRPNASPLIGLNVYGEWGGKYYFLVFSKGKWIDVSRQLVPLYRKSNVYKIPRYGTTVAVFEREQYDSNIQQGLEGKQLYSLKWRKGRFHIVK